MIMKENERLRKIRDFLLRKKRAIWTDIQKNTGIQPKELSYDLKELLKRGEIICEQNMHDRRKTWYMLKDERRTHTELRRYEAIKFIENLSNPSFKEEAKKVEDYEVVMSWFFEGTDKKKLDEMLEESFFHMDIVARAFLVLATAFKQRAEEELTKFAVVVTSQKKLEGAEKEE